VAGPDGRTVIIRAQYLAGADSARSTVRHLSGQQLDGSFAGEDVLLGDVEADHHYTRSASTRSSPPGRHLACGSRSAATGYGSSPSFSPGLTRPVP